MRRREFIGGGLAGGVAFAVGSRALARGQGQADGASEAEKLARLSVMTYCFDRIVVEDAKWTLKQISDYAKTQKVFCDVENRDGGRPTANAPPNAPVRGGWEVLVEVLKAGGGYANPDIGNFPVEDPSLRSG